MNRKDSLDTEVIGPESHYQGEAGQRYHQAVHGRVIDDPEAYTAKAELARYRYFDDLPRTTKVLEYGAGTGFSLYAVTAQERAAYDVSETARRICEEHGLTVYSHAQEIPKNHFDVVLCRHVLEHLANPGEALAIIRNTLVPGGQLLLVIPVEDSGRHLRSIPAPDVHMHLHAWSLKHLSNLLVMHGYQPRRHAYFWYSMQVKLNWLRKVAGTSVYDRAVSIAGRLRRQCELAVWAERL